MDEIRAEQKQLIDLIRTLADHVAGLSSRVERGTFQTTRIANASEETNALALTEVRELRADKAATLKELQEIRVALAVLVDNVKDVETVARENTGAHPLQPLDISDSEKAERWTGRIVLGLIRNWKTALAILSASGASAETIHLLHVFKVLH